MTSPYMNKERVRDTMSIIDSLTHCLSAFLDSDGDDFYDKIEYSAPLTKKRLTKTSVLI